MTIDSISINDERQVVIEIDGVKRLLPNGVFRNAAGEEISVSDGRIASVVTEASTLPAEKLVAVAQDLASDMLESAQRLDSAVSRVKDLQRTFHMRYLALQQGMQQEVREFALLSNIMKTKHEAAKNAINNMR